MSSEYNKYHYEKHYVELQKYRRTTAYMSRRKEYYNRKADQLREYRKKYYQRTKHKPRKHPSRAIVCDKLRILEENLQFDNNGMILLYFDL